MKNEYNFSKAKKAKVSKEIKVVKTFRLDPDVIAWLEAEGRKQGMGYQTFLNWYLRQCMGENSSIEQRLEKLEQALFKKKA